MFPIPLKVRNVRLSVLWHFPHGRLISRHIYAFWSESLQPWIFGCSQTAQWAAFTRKIHNKAWYLPFSAFNIFLKSFWVWCIFRSTFACQASFEKVLLWNERIYSHWSEFLPSIVHSFSERMQNNFDRVASLYKCVSICLTWYRHCKPDSANDGNKRCIVVMWL